MGCRHGRSSGGGDRGAPSRGGQRARAAVPGQRRAPPCRTGLRAWPAGSPRLDSSGHGCRPGMPAGGALTRPAPRAAGLAAPQQLRHLRHAQLLPVAEHDHRPDPGREFGQGGEQHHPRLRIAGRREGRLEGRLEGRGRAAVPPPALLREITARQHGAGVGIHAVRPRDAAPAPQQPGQRTAHQVVGAVRVAAQQHGGLIEPALTGARVLEELPVAAHVLSRRCPPCPSLLLESRSAGKVQSRSDHGSEGSAAGLHRGGGPRKPSRPARAGSGVSSRHDTNAVQHAGRHRGKIQAPRDRTSGHLSRCPARSRGAHGGRDRPRGPWCACATETAPVPGGPVPGPCHARAAAAGAGRLTRRSTARTRAGADAGPSARSPSRA
jgi:hypothetical protein